MAVYRFIGNACSILVDNDEKYRIFLIITQNNGSSNHVDVRIFRRFACDWGTLKKRENRWNAFPNLL